MSLIRVDTTATDAWDFRPGDIVVQCGSEYSLHGAKRKMGIVISVIPPRRRDDSSAVDVLWCS